MVAAPASSEAQLPSRVLEIRPEESKLVCVCADAREFALSRLIGSNVRVGDELLAPASAGTAIADTEIYIRKPSLRRADVYQVKAGYAALPKMDKREEPFVRVQVAEGQLGINVIHIPCHVIRDYFFAEAESLVAEPAYFLLRASSARGRDVQGTASRLSAPAPGVSEAERIQSRASHD
jgi:hypothetical protein